MICRFLKKSLMLALTGLFAFSAHADLVRVDYTGTVTSVTANLSGTFSVGDLLTGSFLYDADTSPRAGATVNSAAFDALVEHEFQYATGGGNYSAGIPVTPGGLAELQIDNAGGGVANDRFGLLSRASEGLSGPDADGLSLASQNIRLDDLSNTVFDTALALPTGISLSDFDSGSFFTFFGDNFEGLVRGDITSLQSTAIPEPAGAAILFLGILAWSMTRRKRTS